MPELVKFVSCTQEQYDKLMNNNEGEDLLTFNHTENNQEVKESDS